MVAVGLAEEGLRMEGSGGLQPQPQSQALASAVLPTAGQQTTSQRVLQPLGPNLLIPR